MTYVPRVPRVPLVSLVAAALGASVLLVGCGSSAVTPGGGDAGPVVIDGSIGDGATDTGGPATGDSSVADAADTGPHCLVAGTTQAACRTCCENGFNAGYKIFANETIACACQPQFCGPLDGGSVEAGADGGDAGDAGDLDAAVADDGGAHYGVGICTTTCEKIAAPSNACNTCIYSTLGSVASLGPCASTILGQCLTDPDCSAYFGCVQNCP